MEPHSEVAEMISIEEARSVILQHITLLPSEDVPLLQGLERVVSEDIHAPWDIPSADNSAMDGYAFSHAALQGNCLKVTGFLPAGSERKVPVAAGEAVKIMTGAPIPPGCDTVVPIEDVEQTGEGIRLTREIRAGSHIRKRGDDVTAGDRTIAAGTVLRPQEIGMLVSLGKTSAPVHRLPNVAVLATGDELIAAGSTPVPGKIINSNSYSIAAQVREAGGNPVLQGIADDDPDSTRDKILAGLEADFLITTGGVSMGDKDYVKEVILSLGGEIKFWKVNMKPGKPFTFAWLNGKPVFALPGNPVSAMIGFELFVRPAMLKMMGHSRIFRPVVKATVTETMRNEGDRPHLVFVRIILRDGKHYVSSTGIQSSSRLSSMTTGNGFVEMAPGTLLVEGDEVDVTLMNRVFN
jgi:molybdopterin molybdotransferase